MECSCLICEFYLYCWHGMYIVATFPVLCNVILWMQINTNTNTKNLQQIKKHVCKDCYFLYKSAYFEGQAMRYLFEQ